MWRYVFLVGRDWLLVVRKKEMVQFFFFFSDKENHESQ